MATIKKSSSITIDLEMFLIPVSILLSAIMVSASIIYAFGGGTTTSARGSNVVATDSSIESLVEEVNVDLKKFQECVQDNDFKDEIAKDMKDGQDAGITGTPGFIIGQLDSSGNVKGEILSGAQPFASFKTAINNQLDGKGDSSVTIGIDDDPLLGDKNKAKVAIVEFSDFECPFCQRFHNETFDDIIKEFVDTGKAIYVYRDYPLSFHEPKASEAASAANCIQKVAGDEKYFEFAKLYYERTKSNGEGL